MMSILKNRIFSQKIFLLIRVKLSDMPGRGEAAQREEKFRCLRAAASLFCNRDSITPRISPKRQKNGEKPAGFSPQLVEKPLLRQSARVLAGELEGAAARLEWDRMP